jgi:hypothetical protein
MSFKIRGWTWWWRDLRYGIGNLIKWFPFVWADRDWDYTYWLNMNIKKLGNMEHSLRTYGNHTRSEQDADNIHLAVMALERVIADEYITNAFKNHDKKYGELKIAYGPPREKGLVECLFSRDRAISDQDKNYEHKASSRLHRHADYMKKQDLEFATKIINKYLYHWWD